ncbi:MAG: ABC transporter ATP-binding protein [Acidimicrobiia bacterium]
MRENTTESTDKAVVADKLTKRFGPVEAAKEVSFDVEVGEMFGFLGPNGAGKTTTISILCTLLRPTSGRAVVAGYDVVAFPDAVRRSIGLVFQDPTLDDLLTAEQNLQFHGALYGLPRSQMRKRIDQVLEMVGLSERRKELVRNFSGGMRRRLEIARGLMHNPRVLFLDEPTIGLDPQTRAHIWEYIDELRRKEEVTIFLTTHYMEEAERCSRIAIIDFGEIVAIDTPSALKASVGMDRVTLSTEDNERAAAELRAKLGVEPSIRDGEIIFHVTEGAAFIPKVFEAIDTPVRSIATQRPTLDDVFMKYTGRAMRDSEAGAEEMNRASPWVRGHLARR